MSKKLRARYGFFQMRIGTLMVLQFTGGIAVWILVRASQMWLREERDPTGAIVGLTFLLALEIAFLIVVGFVAESYFWWGDPVKRRERANKE